MVPTGAVGLREATRGDLGATAHRQRLNAINDYLKIIKKSGKAAAGSGVRAVAIGMSSRVEKDVV